MYQHGKIVSLGQVPSLSHIESIAASADFHYLLRQLERIESSIDADPWLAIGTAKELVETVCKSILADLQKPLAASWDLMELCKATRKELKLTPDDIPDTNKAADTIKKLLNNLATIVQGLAELRNPYGTGHGHHGRARGLQPRHSRLAAGAWIIKDSDVKDFLLAIVTGSESLIEPDSLKAFQVLLAEEENRKARVPDSDESDA